MTDAIVVVNAGSSSLKFSLFAQAGDELALIVRGQVEGLHTAPRFVAKSAAGETIATHRWSEGTPLGHDGALEHIVAFLQDQAQGLSLKGMGHRVVHGGLQYAQPVRMDRAV
jgi:acetate kinase